MRNELAVMHDKLVNTKLINENNNEQNTIENEKF
jgi:hypothetical protein